MKTCWRVVWMSVITLAWLGWLSASARAQGHVDIAHIVHAFAGSDGATPVAGLIKDASGNLYGTTSAGGASGNGTVFKLEPSGNLTALYSFTGSNGDGATPQAGLLMDASGNLYGTTVVGGASSKGTVFELVNSSGSYTEKVLYSFAGANGDGAGPVAGLVTDASGNLYGTTKFGGGSASCYLGLGCGTVFKLVNSSGSYTETVLHSFTGANGDGGEPFAGLLMDASGNLYGTTAIGGASGLGTVFELVNSSGSYTETVLHSFTGANGDGADPFASLIMDSSGNLYGTTPGGGASGNCGTSGCGTVFELVNSSGSYTEKVLYSFTGNGLDEEPVAGLLMDASGNLYGTTGSGPGTVFELVNSSGSYTETVLFNFGASNICISHGSLLVAGLVMDASGILYGTTEIGGANGYGTVFKVTPHSTPIATTTTLTSSTNPATAGDGLVLTATISSASGVLTPTGTMTFSNGSTTLDTQTVGCGPLTLKFEDADAVGIGTFTITAQYTPDTSTFAASAGTVLQTVNEQGAAVTNGANTFSANQTVNGTLTATSFVGNGSGLTGITAQSAQTANTANFATSAGTATTATTANNALMLGGVLPGGYAPASGAANYIQNNSGAAQSASLNISGAASVGGSVTIGSSGTAITEHVSVLENPSFPALKSGACAKANFTLTGAADGDTIALGVPNERMTGSGILIYTAWVSAPGTVTLQGCNFGGSPQKTAGTGSIRMDLWKH